VVRHRVLVPAFGGSNPSAPARCAVGHFVWRRGSQDEAAATTCPYSEEMKIFSGSASQALTKGICDHLLRETGQGGSGPFSDGEVRVQIGENVRGKDVFIVNSTSPPINDNLMELLI
jgi:hypothetical protein